MKFRRLNLNANFTVQKLSIRFPLRKAQFWGIKTGITSHALNFGLKLSARDVIAPSFIILKSGSENHNFLLNYIVYPDCP